MRVWLPVATINEEGARTFQREPEPEPAPEIRSLHILAVDDDALVLLNTAAMLEELGHDVYPAGSGAEALCRSWPPTRSTSWSPTTPCRR